MSLDAGLIPTNQEAWGWQGRTLGKPVTTPDGTAWLRLASAPRDEIVDTFWNGTVEAQRLLPRSIPRPQLHRWADWSDQKWAYRAELRYQAAARVFQQDATPERGTNAFLFRASSGLSVQEARLHYYTPTPFGGAVPGAGGVNRFYPHPDEPWLLFRRDAELVEMFGPGSRWVPVCTLANLVIGKWCRLHTDSSRLPLAVLRDADGTVFGRWL